MYLAFEQQLVDFFWGAMVPFVDLIPGILCFWLLFYFVRQLIFSER